MLLPGEPRTKRTVTVEVSELFAYLRDKEQDDFIARTARAHGILPVDYYTVERKQPGTFNLQIDINGWSPALPGWDADGRPTEEWPT